MKRLYQHIYAAQLFSLIAFAIFAGAMWLYSRDETQPGGSVGMVAAFAELAIPAGDRPASDLEAALSRLRDRSGADLAVYAPNGALLASVGARLPLDERPTGGDYVEEHWTPSGKIWTIVLRDGRAVVVRRSKQDAIPQFLLLLGAGLVALGIGAYPIARRLSRRIETLMEGVEAFGAGDLSKRVAVSGKDEVALLADSFNRTAGRIQALISAHKTLLANASHELRSPLTRLRMAVEILETHADDPKLRKEFESNIAELDQLVDEILLASRLDADVGGVTNSDVDLLELTAEECAAASASIEGAPITIQGDERLLRRLVRNLLDNARRYGGGTEIEVSLQRGDGDVITLAVCDRGPGVAEEERERIFEPFYRPTGTRESEGGVGLGLALVKQIARRHDGEVRCVARPGGGTCFEVRLHTRSVAGNAHGSKNSGPAVDLEATH